MVEPAHPDSSSGLSTGACIFLNLFQDLTGALISLVSGVTIDSETFVVTSSISSIRQLNLFGGAHRSRVAYMRVSVPALCFK